MIIWNVKLQLPLNSLLLYLGSVLFFMLSLQMWLYFTVARECAHKFYSGEICWYLFKHTIINFVNVSWALKARCITCLWDIGFDVKKFNLVSFHLFLLDFLRKDLNFINNQSLNLILGVCNIFLLYSLALGAGKPNIDEMSIFYFLVSVKYDVGCGFKDLVFLFLFLPSWCS